MHSKRYLYWPIKIKWRSKKKTGFSSKSWFKTHGWQIGWDGFAMGVFGWTFHLNNLKVCFGGEKFNKKPHKQIFIPIHERG